MSKFGTYIGGQFKEIKEIATTDAEPFWTAEDQHREYKLQDIKLKQTFSAEILNQEPLQVLAADFAKAPGGTITAWLKYSVYNARPHKKKRIAKKWAKQGKYKTHRAKLCGFSIGVEEADAHTFTITARRNEDGMD